MLENQNCRMCRLKLDVNTAFFILLFCSFPISFAYAQTLSVEEYLGQVSQSHQGYRSLRAQSEGALHASKSASLLFKPQAFTNAQYIYDPRTTHAPSIEGYRNIHRNISFGLRQQTNFGLQLQLSVDYAQGTLLGTNPAFVINPNLVNFFVIPTFNFSLWQNLLGRMDRANKRLTEAQSLATAYGSRFGAQATLVEAEGRYWKLVVIREAIRLQEKSVQRAKSLVALETRKIRRHLVDSSDVLLGEATLQGKNLELKSMIAEERSAARSFNSARGINSNTVHDELALPSVESIQNIILPKRTSRRGDVHTAEQQAIAAQAGNELARENLLPNLSVYGSIFAVGLAFSIPIDQSLTQEARKGYAQQGQAAELNFERKLFEEEADWNDLMEKFSYTQERLIVALKLEEIQQRKFEETRSKLTKGLTVAFQVFQYELEYLSASLARLQLEGNLLGIRAQMRFYEPS